MRLWKAAAGGKQKQHQPSFRRNLLACKWKLHDINCQGFQLWVGATPKSKHGGPQARNSERLSFILRWLQINMSLAEGSPHFFSIPPLLHHSQCLCFWGDYCQLSALGVPGLPVGQQCHISAPCELINMLRRECVLWSKSLCCIYEFYGRRSLPGLWYDFIILKCTNYAKVCG